MKTHIAFDEMDAYLCSEPRKIEFLNGTQLVQNLSERLKGDQRPLREKISEFSDGLSGAKRRAENIRAERSAQASRARPSARAQSAVDALAEDSSDRVITPVPTRQARQLTGAAGELRNIADEAAKNFDSQFVIIQPRRG